MSVWYDRFNKEWASLGQIQDPSDAQANSGYAFLGQAPPTVELFNSIQKWNDQKDHWLYQQIANAINGLGQTTAETDLLGLLHAIQFAASGAAVGFTPVQQGGGVGQGTNKVRMGYATNNSGVKVQVDTTDFGNIAFVNGGYTWPNYQAFSNGLEAKGLAATGAGGVSSSTTVYAAAGVSSGTYINSTTSMSAGTTINANGNITSDGGKLRALVGSDGDGNAATLNNEFGVSVITPAPAGVLVKTPNWWIQLWYTTLNWSLSATVATDRTFPFAFPTNHYGSVLNYAGNLPPAAGVNPALAFELLDRFTFRGRVGQSNVDFLGPLGVSIISVGN